MKAVWIAIVFLVFNMAMGVVVNSTLYSGTYYDSAIVEHYEDMSQFENLSKTDIEPQTSDVWDYILNPLSFNWANQYTTQIGLQAELSPFILGLNALMLLIYGIALIEMFWRRSDILPS